MFGQQTLFTDFTSDLPHFSAPDHGSGQGDEEERRRNYLIPERNALVANRFYYFDQIKKFKSSFILENLSREFFLSERRMVDLIYILSPLINEVREKKPALKELAQKYPWINWNA